MTSSIEGNIDNIVISLCDDYEEKLEWVLNNSNRDGYYYPPMFATYELDPISLEQKKKVERSERPAAVFHLPPSHEITINNSTDVENASVSDESLIIHLLGFLYNTRLQFKEWRFEGRVPIEKNNSFILLQDEDAFHFLSHVYEWWLKQDDTTRAKYINIVYLYCRARSLEWEWDSFTHQYMVFDAIFNIFSSKSNNKTFVPHKKRMLHLCKHFGIIYDLDLLERLSNIRNELFHEALWNGGLMGMSIAGNYEISCLSRLNARLICNIAGYSNNFSRSQWGSYGWQLFDKLS